MSDETTQPTTFPVTVEEWAHGRTAPERFLVAGFVMHIRRTQGLLEKLPPEAWDAQLATYSTAPAGTAAK